MGFSIKTVEFDIIKEQVKNYAYSKLASVEIEDANPSVDILNVEKMLNETNELINIISKFGNLPFLENFDNNILNTNRRIERIYTIQELLFLKLYLKMSMDIDNYFRNNLKDIKSLYIRPLTQFNNHNKLYYLLNDTFNDYGEIYDNASHELKEIRNKIRSLEATLSKKLNDMIKKFAEYLSEGIIVTRNGRSCLAVKDTYKNKIQGVIHDISASKQTVFIEPEISLQIMAEIEMERILENKEIEKILYILSNNVNDNFDSLQENLNMLVNIDIINAKARYSLEINGIKPKVNKDGIINLINAKHPLIDPKKVVPISLELNKNKNALLITGPNTGGKTVTLKTVGLLTMMVQSGILVPVGNDSELAIFDNIFVDIGDEQSIENSLSTFSSHISKIISFVNELTNNSLVLLDELGSGTDPNEGVALAIAIIEELLKKNIRLIVTSHFSELKTYAYEKSSISLASVAFDEETLKPLYHLEHGIIGQSHARLIAKRLGMKNEIIEHANELFMKKETELTKIIDRLSKDRQLLNEEKRRINELESKYLKELEEFNETRTKLIEEQNAVLNKIREQEEKKWQKKIDEVNELLKQIDQKNNTEKHLVAHLKGAINEGIENKQIKINETINVGDKVYVNSYQQYGYVTKINNNKYNVKIGLFELNFSIDDIKVVTDEPKKKEEYRPRKNQNFNQHRVEVSSNMSVDLRGFRFEEVSNELDKAIDKALLSNINSLTIIHGFGTGAVKKAVDNYIKRSNLIKSHRLGGEGEGLAGVTVITLK